MCCDLFALVPLHAQAASDAASTGSEAMVHNAASMLVPLHAQAASDAASTGSEAMDDNAASRLEFRANPAMMATITAVINDFIAASAVL